MNKYRQTLFLLLSSIVIFIGCDQLMTEAPQGEDLFDSPFPGLSSELTLEFLRGDEAFGHAFSAQEGLGPLFNNVSCAACHSGDGRGANDNVFLRFSRGHDLLIPEGGPQLQVQAIPGVSPETLPAGVEVSPRLPPPVFGVGLIEAIPEETILANADSADANGDGISGRANWVFAPDYVPPYEVGGGDGLRLGRFSRKANISALLAQIVGAYHEDIGITTDFRPVEINHPNGNGYALGDAVADPELPAATVLNVLVYLRLLAPPAPGEETQAVVRGRTLFHENQCAACHIPVMTTGQHTIPQLSRVEAHLYSDLLLHDMGESLADHRPDGGATGTEWKTPPLWGLRITNDFLNSPGFLHDGRARSIEEAILLHGGEAQSSRDLFAALNSQDKAALLEFVSTR